MGFILLFSLTLIYVIIPENIMLTSMQAAESFTARTWPNLLSWGMLITSVIGLSNAVMDFFAARKEEGSLTHEKKSPEEIEQLLFPYLIFVLILVYGLLFIHVGYLAATLIVPPVILWLLRCRKWKMYVVMYAFGAMIYLLFKFILRVPVKL